MDEDQAKKIQHEYALKVMLAEFIARKKFGDEKYRQFLGVQRSMDDYESTLKEFPKITEFQKNLDESATLEEMLSKAKKENITVTGEEMEEVNNKVDELIKEVKNWVDKKVSK